MPFRSGPRYCGQSGAAPFRERWSTASTATSVDAATSATRCLAHRAEDTTSYTVLMVKKAALFALAVADRRRGSSTDSGAADRVRRNRLASAGLERGELRRARGRPVAAARAAGRISRTDPDQTPAAQVRCPQRSADAGSERTRPTETDQPCRRQLATARCLTRPGRLPVRRRRPGPTSAGGIATAATTRPPFGRTGRARAYRRCGSSRSGLATRRLWRPTAAPSRSSSAGARKSSGAPTTSRRAASCGPTAGRASSSNTMGGDGPRATPTYHEGRLYALGALGELRCLDAQNGRPRLAPEHPRRQRRVEPGLGHGRRSAHRRRQGHRSAGRPARQIGRGVPTGERRADLDVARRSAGLHVADARHARRRATDPDRQRDARRRPHVDDGRLLWEYPWVDVERDQCRATAAARRRSRVPVGRLRPRRGRVRGHAHGRGFLDAHRSGRTRG